LRSLNGDQISKKRKAFKEKRKTRPYQPVKPTQPVTELRFY